MRAESKGMEEFRRVLLEIGTRLDDLEGERDSDNVDDEYEALQRVRHMTKWVTDFDGFSVEVLKAKLRLVVSQADSGVEFAEDMGRRQDKIMEVLESLKGERTAP